MKIVIVQILFLALLADCSDESVKTDVEIFIEQVTSDSYLADTLPAFSPDAIPKLLEYANDFSEISHFPINPISAFAPTKFTVGECLLWTIEHIRLSYGNYTSYSFPSFVSELKIKEDINSERLTDAQLLEVYNLYFNWWYDNEKNNFETFRNIDPLKESNYVWK